MCLFLVPELAAVLRNFSINYCTFSKSLLHKRFFLILDFGIDATGFFSQYLKIKNSFFIPLNLKET